jgi:UDP-N-acetylmuramoyl-tripeptide--D-alanyl-D-alanine ligase
LPVPGKYNATNAMVAACVGKLLAVEEEDILDALANIELTRNRTEWKRAANGADILSDVYNANPTAMKLILETFSAIPANEKGQKIVVLADMKELGPDSVQMHTDILKYLDPSVLDQLVLYGEDIQDLADAASHLFPAGSVSYFKKNAAGDQFEDMLGHIQTILQPADQILLKGSNSMNLAKVVEKLEKLG